MSKCTCHPVPFEDCTIYGSAVEPGSAFEPNPNCREHCRRPPHRLADGTWSDGVDRSKPINLRATSNRWEVTAGMNASHVWHKADREVEFDTWAEAIAYADRAARTTKNGDNK